MTVVSDDFGGLYAPGSHHTLAFDPPDGPYTFPLQTLPTHKALGMARDLMHSAGEYPCGALRWKYGDARILSCLLSHRDEVVRAYVLTSVLPHQAETLRAALHAYCSPDKLHADFEEWAKSRPRYVHEDFAACFPMHRTMQAAMYALRSTPSFLNADLITGTVRGATEATTNWLAPFEPPGLAELSDSITGVPVLSAVAPDRYLKESRVPRSLHDPKPDTTPPHLRAQDDGGWGGPAWHEELVRALGLAPLHVPRMRPPEPWYSSLHVEALEGSWNLIWRLTSDPLGGVPLRDRSSPDSTRVRAVPFASLGCLIRHPSSPVTPRDDAHPKDTLYAPYDPDLWTLHGGTSFDQLYTSLLDWVVRYRRRVMALRGFALPEGTPPLPYPGGFPLAGVLSPASPLLRGLYVPT